MSGAVRVAPSSRRGVSLLEVLLTLSLMGAVFSASIWLLVRGVRFYERSAETIDARQSLRSTLELMTSELRQASAADFLAAASDSLTLRFDVSRAVVCDSTGVDEVALVVFDTVRAPNLPSTFRGVALADPYSSSFTFADGWRATVAEKGSAARAICEARGSVPDLPGSRYRLIRGWRSRFPGLPPAGSVVRVYGRLTYRHAPSTFASGLAVWRNGQEAAAPFAASSRFTYLMADGEERDEVPPPAVGEIRAVRIHLTATGRSGGTRFQPPVRVPAEHLVLLRN